MAPPYRFIVYQSSSIINPCNLFHVSNLPIQDTLCMRQIAKYLANNITLKNVYSVEDHLSNKFSLDQSERTTGRPKNPASVVLRYCPGGYIIYYYRGLKKKKKNDIDPRTTRFDGRRCRVGPRPTRTETKADR